MKLLKILCLLMTFAVCFSACKKDEQTKTGSISGIVTNLAGEPVKSATVTILHTPENFNPDKNYTDKEWDNLQSQIYAIESTMTGSDGYFEFHDIRVGKYYLHAETWTAYNYFPIVVTEGKTTRADIRIIPDMYW